MQAVATNVYCCEVDPGVQDCKADTSLDYLHFPVQNLADLVEETAAQADDGEANYLHTFLLETSAAAAAAGIDMDSVVERLQGCCKG